MYFTIRDFVLIVSIISGTCAAPITVLFTDQYGRHFAMPFYGQQTPIERSDNLQAQATEYNSGSYGHQYEGGFEPSSGHIGGDHQDYSTYKAFDHASHEDNSQLHEDFDHGNQEGLHGDGFSGDNHVHSVPVSEHVEVTKPVAVPVYKEIGYPVSHPVKIHIPHPVAVSVPQPYPVAVPVSQPVPIQIIKTVAVPVEKKVPYPVEKHIPVPIEKPVPITIERHIPVPVEKPYPIKVPVHKTIHHHSKSHHGR
ncbi:uncharacterized protein [Chelonus insularis]|uniref:uncharacterized protein n=1 Tax=Chelonus insularis TaxID=460826 RepID=UPI00158C47AF|nr:uncharacterized protein LOC118074442 [Chelonus insularis]